MPTRWDRVFERLYGYPVEEKGEPKYYGPLRLMAKDLTGEVDRLAPMILKKVSGAIAEAGLASLAPYVYYVLLERPQNWPRFSSSLGTGLQLATSILSRYTAVPNYTSRLETPPEDREKEVDQVLATVASWCATDMKRQMQASYKKVLAKHAPNVSKAAPSMEGLSDAETVASLFEAILQEHSFAIPDSEFLANVIHFLVF